jgi:hypothetical protein
VSNAPIDNELRRQLRENKAFRAWCSKTKKAPNQTISQISGEVLDFMHGYVKTHYARAFLESLKDSSNRIVSIDTKKERDVKFDVSFDLAPLETYIVLSRGIEAAISKIYQKANLYEAKLTLKIDTKQRIPLCVEYEKIKRITMPLGDKYLLYVTTEVEADHSNLIRGLTKVIVE